MNALEFLAEAADNIGVLRGPDASLFSVEQTNLLKLQLNSYAQLLTQSMSICGRFNEVFPAQFMRSLELYNRFIEVRDEYIEYKKNDGECKGYIPFPSHNIDVGESPRLCLLDVPIFRKASFVSQSLKSKKETFPIPLIRLLRQCAPFIDPFYCPDWQILSESCQPDSRHAITVATLADGSISKNLPVSRLSLFCAPGNRASRMSGRQKLFTIREERLLSLGLERFGHGGFIQTAAYVLPDKDATQLKHRVCNAGDEGSPILVLRVHRDLPFSPLEDRILRKTVSRLGKDPLAIASVVMATRDPVSICKRLRILYPANNSGMLNDFDLYMSSSDGIQKNVGDVNMSSLAMKDLQNFHIANNQLQLPYGLGLSTEDNTNNSSLKFSQEDGRSENNRTKRSVNDSMQQKAGIESASAPETALSSPFTNNNLRLQATNVLQQDRENEKNSHVKLSSINEDNMDICGVNKDDKSRKVDLQNVEEEEAGFPLLFQVVNNKTTTTTTTVCDNYGSKYNQCTSSNTNVSTSNTSLNHNISAAFSSTISENHGTETDDSISSDSPSTEPNIKSSLKLLHKSFDADKPQVISHDSVHNSSNQTATATLSPSEVIFDNNNNNISSDFLNQTRQLNQKMISGATSSSLSSSSSYFSPQSEIKEKSNNMPSNVIMQLHTDEMPTITNPSKNIGHSNHQRNIEITTQTSLSNELLNPLENDEHSSNYTNNNNSNNTNNLIHSAHSTNAQALSSSCIRPIRIVSLTDVYDSTSISNDNLNNVAINKNNASSSLPYQNNNNNSNNSNNNSINNNNNNNNHNNVNNRYHWNSFVYPLPMPDPHLPPPQLEELILQDVAFTILTDHITKSAKNNDVIHVDSSSSSSFPSAQLSSKSSTIPSHINKRSLNLRKRPIGDVPSVRRAGLNNTPAAPPLSNENLSLYPQQRPPPPPHHVAANVRTAHHLPEVVEVDSTETALQNAAHHAFAAADFSNLDNHLIPNEMQNSSQTSSITASSFIAANAAPHRQPFLETAQHLLRLRIIEAALINKMEQEWAFMSHHQQQPHFLSTSLHASPQQQQHHLQLSSSPSLLPKSPYQRHLSVIQNNNIYNNSNNNNHIHNNKNTLKIKNKNNSDIISPFTFRPLPKWAEPSPPSSHYPAGLPPPPPMKRQSRQHTKSASRSSSLSLSSPYGSLVSNQEVHGNGVVLRNPVINHHSLHGVVQPQQSPTHPYVNNNNMIAFVNNIDEEVDLFDTPFRENITSYTHLRDIEFRNETDANSNFSSSLQSQVYNNNINSNHNNNANHIKDNSSSNNTSIIPLPPFSIPPFEKNTFAASSTHLDLTSPSTPLLKQNSRSHLTLSAVRHSASSHPYLTDYPTNRAPSTPSLDLPLSIPPPLTANRLNIPLPPSLHHQQQYALGSVRGSNVRLQLTPGLSPKNNFLANPLETPSGEAPSLLSSSMSNRFLPVSPPRSNFAQSFDIPQNSLSSSTFRANGNSSISQAGGEILTSSNTAAVLPWDQMVNVTSPCSMGHTESSDIVKRLNISVLASQQHHVHDQQ